MDTDMKHDKIYRQSPPEFIDNRKTKLLVAYCDEKNITLINNPRKILEFIKYEVRTDEGEAGTLLHYTSKNQEMIILDID